MEIKRQAWEPWKLGQKLPINRVQWDEAERAAVNDVFDRDYFAQGYYVKEFALELARFLGRKERGAVVAVNSGSSALDLAVKTLLKEGFVTKGALVLHPALTFNTSATCIVNNGLHPLFVDVEEGTYNLDPVLVAEAAEEHSVNLAVVPHLLGNTTDLDVMKESLLWTIGDSCDTLGTLWDGKEVSEMCDFTAYSFYGSHHITMGGVGGAIAIKDDIQFYALFRSLTYWGRDFTPVVNTPLEDFLTRYTYNTLGTDAQPTEFQCAFGLAQLAKLPQWNLRRALVFQAINTFMRQYQEFFILPRSHPKATPSWFAYPLTLRATAPFKREVLVEALLRRDIELRPMFSGNTLTQPAWKDVPYVKFRETPNADACLTRAFFIPAWPMPDEALAFLLEQFENAMREVVH